MISLTTLLIIVLVVALFYGVWGNGRVTAMAPWAPAWSPLGFILVLLLVLYLSGNLHLR